MGDTLKLALQLTAVDMMSGILDRVKRHVVSLGKEGEELGRHFDQMNLHLSQGLKGIAAGRYAVNQIAKGITPAADLQEEMINVEMSLAKSGKSASTLNRELDEVRRTAIELQKITPFSAQEMVKAEKEFLQSGVEFSAVIGDGAAKAAAALATISGAPLEQAQSAMLNIGVPYHLKGGDYVQVADVLQRHITSGRLKVGGFEEALKNATAVTKSFNVPWRDLVTGLAVVGEGGFVGSEAGTYYKDFLARLTGASRLTRKAMASANSQLKSEGKQGLNFWDDKGELLPIFDIIKQLRATLGGMDTHHRMFFLNRIFGEQGGQGALALMKTGAGGWEAVSQRAEESGSLTEKMGKRLEGMNASMTALHGTAKTTAAVVFDPMLKPLTKLVQLLNDATAGLGNFAERHKTLTKGANVLMGGAAVAAGGYGIYHLLKGGIAGAKVLKGVGGIKGLLKGGAGTALGIAEGKALQAATGVNPVFVTNWPAGLGGIAGDLAGGVAGGGLTKVLGKGKGVLAAAAGLLPEAGMVAGAGALGYAIGTGINRSLGWLSGKMSDGKYGGAGWLGERIFDATHKSETTNDIKLDIAIDGNGRVTTKSSDPNTKSSINLKRGSFTGDPLLDMNL